MYHQYARAAREGHYCGVTPYGHRVERRKNTCRLVPAGGEAPGHVMTETQAVRHIYRRLALSGPTGQALLRRPREVRPSCRRTCASAGAPASRDLDSTDC